MKVLGILLVCCNVLFSFSALASAANESVTRGQFVEWVMLAAQKELKTEASDSTFNDVPYEHDFYPYIQAAKDLDIVDGYGDGSGNFGPDDKLQKQEAAKILLNTFGFINLPNCAVAPFNDVATNHWSCRYIQKVKALKALSGLFVVGKEIKFYPANEINRATAAKMIAVMYTIAKGYENPFGYMWDLSNDSLTGGYGDAVSIGNLYEQNIADSPSEISFSIQAPSTIQSGESATLNVSTSCTTCTFYWEGIGGQFLPINSDFSSVEYIAPRVSVADKRVYLYVFVSDGSGATSVQKQPLLITSTVEEPSASALFSSVYSQSEDKFYINYQVANNVSYMQIDVSFDNSSWSTEYTRVIYSNYADSKALSVEGSDDHNEIYFRIGTRTSNEADLLFTDVQSLEYELPPPYVEKGTEIPVAPALHGMSGTHVSPHVTLSWRKVLDSHNNDNASYYEVMWADNFAFNNETVETAPNTATGDNLFESIRYEVRNLADNDTYYFKVRAVNNLGEGSWSNVESARVDYQNLPVFTYNNFSPDNEAVNVSKLPDFCWNADDPDGDDLEFKLEWGYSSDNLNKDTSFNEGAECYDFAAEGERPFGPNKTIYWRVLVREDGRYKDYYGGSYPKSDIFSFTTVASGEDLEIVNAQLTSELTFDDYATFDLTIRNNGSESVDARWIQAIYVKGDTASEFHSGSVLTPEVLAPNQEVIVPIRVRFRDEIITSNSGKEYDNILIAGESIVRFEEQFISDQDTVPENNSFDVAINYEDAGGPRIDDFLIHTDYAMSEAENAFSKQGGEVEIFARVSDDLAGITATIEYNLTDDEQGWALIESFASDSERILFKYNANGEQVSESNGSYIWHIPDDIELSNIAKIRLTATDSLGNVTSVDSHTFKIVGDNLSATIGELEKSSYKVGEEVTLAVDIDSAYSVEFYEVKLNDGRRVWDLDGTKEGPVPSEIIVRLPNDNQLVTEAAKLSLRVSAEFANEITVESDSFAITANTELPDPFRQSYQLYTPKTPPNGALKYNSFIGPVYTEIDSNELVHMVVHEGESYFDVNKDYKNTHEYFYTTINPLTLEKTEPIKIPQQFKVIDFKLVSNSKPYLLLESGNKLAYATIENNQLSAIEYLLNENSPAASFDALTNININYPYIIGDRIYSLDDLKNSINYYDFIGGVVGNKYTLPISSDYFAYYDAKHPRLITHSGNRIYFVELDAPSKLVEVDITNQTVKAVNLPYRYSSEDDQANYRYKIALTEHKGDIFLLMRGELYKLGDGLEKITDIVHQHGDKTADFKANWNEVDDVHLLSNGSKLTIVIDWEQNLSIPNRNELTVLEYDTENSAFGLNIFKPDVLASIFDNRAYSSSGNIRDSIYLGDDKLLLLYDANFSESPDISHKDLGLSVFDINTGASFFLGSVVDGISAPNISSVIPAIQLSNGKPYIFLDNQLQPVSLVNLEQPIKHFESPQLQMYQDELHVTYKFGVEYDGRDGNLIAGNQYYSKIELPPLGLLRSKQLYPALEAENTVSDIIAERYLDNFDVVGEYAFVENKNFYPLNNDFTIPDSPSCQFTERFGLIDLDVNSQHYLAVVGEYDYSANTNRLKLLNKDCSIAANIATEFVGSDLVYNGKLKGLLNDSEFILFGSDNSNTYIFKYDIASDELSTVVLPLKQGDISANASINVHKNMAITWAENGIPFIAFGSMDGDIIAPVVTLTTDVMTAASGETIEVSWQASDNQNQLNSYSLYVSKNGGDEVLQQQYSNNSISSYGYVVPNEPDLTSLTFKMIVDDSEGNWGVATTQVTVLRPIIIDSFEVNKSNYQRGEDIVFNWSITGLNDQDNVQLLRRKIDAVEWNIVANNISQNTYTLNTSSLSGEYVFKLNIRGVSEELNIAVEGVWLEFDYSRFAPVNVAYLSAEFPVLNFAWDADVGTEPQWYAELFIKTDQDVEFNSVDVAQLKQFEWKSDFIPEVIEWYVIVNLQGVEFKSDIQTVAISTLNAVENLAVNLIDNHTSSPKLQLSYTLSIPEATVLLQRNKNFTQYETLTTLNDTNYEDIDVQYGDTISYRLIVQLADAVSGNVDTESIGVTALLPTAIALTASDELGSGDVVSFTVLDSNPVFEYYEVVLGLTQQAESFWDTIAKTYEREAVIPELIAGQIYTLKVYALSPLGERLVGVSEQLTFAAPYNISTLNVAPTIHTATTTTYSNIIAWDDVNGAEEYLIYRASRDNSDWQLLKVNEDTHFEDTSLNIGTAYRYKVEATNVFYGIESAPTDWLVIDVNKPVITVPDDIIVAAIDEQGVPATNSDIVAFLNGATAYDELDGNLTNIVNDAPTQFPIGITTVTFSATDSNNNTGSATAKVEVKDLEKPVITLLGDGEITIGVGGAYNESGATATDNIDGDISSNIVITGEVDTSTVGVYTLSYSISDNAGNEADVVTRVVTVEETLVTLSVSATEVIESGEAIELTAKLNYAILADVTVKLALSGTAVIDSDYEISATDVVIKAEETSANVILTAKQDVIGEQSETIIIDVEAVINAKEDDKQQLTVVIIDSVAVEPFAGWLHLLLNGNDQDKHSESKN